jgi:hypothetical protein
MIGVFGDRSNPFGVAIPTGWTRLDPVAGSALVLGAEGAAEDSEVGTGRQ